MEIAEIGTSTEEVPDPAKCITSRYEFIEDFISYPDFLAVTKKYPFFSTKYYLSLATYDYSDPILRQLCPSIEELREDENVLDDPLAEEKNSPVPGIVHRYSDRVLMLTTNVCFMNCRHCTRKRLWKAGRFVYKEQEIKAMVDYIQKNPQIKDVVLSGGDPLTLSNALLDEILGRLRAVQHVEIIRIGTRAPVVYPQRIDEGLIKVLKKYRPIWLNTQFNHGNEITDQSTFAVNRILEAGIPVNNQSVLLKGINDNVEAITNLCRRLLTIGVRPYYLFHCDPASGTAHFRTSISKGIEIIEKMRGRVSGLAIPNFVVDAVNGGGKIPLQPNYLVFRQEDKIVLRNYKWQQFEYSDKEK